MSCFLYELCVFLGIQLSFTPNGLKQWVKNPSIILLSPWYAETQWLNSSLSTSTHRYWFLTVMCTHRISDVCTGYHQKYHFLNQNQNTNQVLVLEWDNISQYYSLVCAVINPYSFNGIEWNEMELNGMEWNWLEWNCIELNWIEWNWTEFKGMKKNGIELNLMEWNEIELNGMELIWMKFHGIEWNEIEWN